MKEATDSEDKVTESVQTIHADIAEKNGKIQGACGINPGRGIIPGHSFVYHRCFDSYRIGDGETKCGKCERALARLTRHTDA